MEARPIFSFEPLKTHAIKFPGHPHSLLISQTDLLSRGVSVTWALNSRVSPWPQARRGSVSDLPTHQEIIGRIIVGQDLPLRPFLVNPGCARRPLASEGRRLWVISSRTLSSKRDSGISATGVIARGCRMDASDDRGQTWACGAESERSPILEIPEQITDRYDPDDTAVLSDREMPDALLCHEVARLMGRAIDFHRDHRRTHHGSRWLA